MELLPGKCEALSLKKKKERKKTLGILENYESSSEIFPTWRPLFVSTKCENRI
jgi:hypothetical protein